MAKVRAAIPGHAVVVRHPETGQYLSYQAGQEVDDKDPMVTAHPWLFGDDAPVEAATAVPGAKRVTKRAARKAAEQTEVKDDTESIG